MAYYTHNQVASGIYNIIAWSTLVIIIHSSGPLFTTEVEPFVFAASDHTCTKIKESNFFSVTEEQFYEEVISSFTSEGDYILTNNTSPCKLLSMQHKIAFVMQNN